MIFSDIRVFILTNDKHGVILPIDALARGRRGDEERAGNEEGR